MKTHDQLVKMWTIKAVFEEHFGFSYWDKNDVVSEK